MLVFTYDQLETAAAQFRRGDSFLEEDLDERLSDELVHQLPGEVGKRTGHEDA